MPERVGSTIQCPKCNSMMYFDSIDVCFQCPICHTSAPTITDENTDHLKKKNNIDK